MASAISAGEHAGFRRNLWVAKRVRQINERFAERIAKKIQVRLVAVGDAKPIGTRWLQVHCRTSRSSLLKFYELSHVCAS